MSNIATAGENKTFDGLVATDAEGWVVWLYRSADVMAWDFMPETLGIVFVGTLADAPMKWEDDGMRPVRSRRPHHQEPWRRHT